MDVFFYTSPKRTKCKKPKAVRMSSKSNRFWSGLSKEMAKREKEINKWHIDRLMAAKEKWHFTEDEILHIYGEKYLRNIGYIE